MRILVIGSNSLLGCDLMEQLALHELVPATAQDADIRNLDQVRRLVSRAVPDWIILTAAFTDVDGAERTPELAFAVNRDGTAHVARAAKESAAKLLYVSTDYVFDGASERPYEPDAPIHPLSVYGASKAAGEEAVRQNASHWIIARTSWLFGSARPSFPEKILSAARAQKELRVVNDQIGSPTYTRDLARAIGMLLGKDANGIVHIANSGSCSWFEFAKEIVRRSGSNIPVLPISTAEANRPARRPAYSVLSPASLASHGIKLRNWQEALDAYIEELRGKGKLN